MFVTCSTSFLSVLFTGDAVGKFKSVVTAVVGSVKFKSVVTDDAVVGEFQSVKFKSVVTAVVGKFQSVVTVPDKFQVEFC